MSLNDLPHAESTSNDRIRHAVSTITTASRSARERLDKHNEQTWALTLAAVLLGSLGLLGLLGLVALKLDDRASGITIGGLAALAACAPSALLLVRARMRTESETLIALEQDRCVLAEAKALASLVSGGETRPTLDGAVPLWALLDRIEDAAAGARARESRIRSQLKQRVRRHERIKPKQDRAILTTRDSRKLWAGIIDVSVSGVGIMGNFPGCKVGDAVRIGAKHAKIVRLVPNGIALEFLVPIPESAFSADLVL